MQFTTIFKLLSLVYNSLRGSGPIHLQNKLKVKTCKRSTRLSTDLPIILQTSFNRKRTLADIGFSYMVVIHWNNLLSSIKGAANIKDFKRQLYETYVCIHAGMCVRVCTFYFHMIGNHQSSQTATTVRRHQLRKTPKRNCITSNDC